MNARNVRYLAVCALVAGAGTAGPALGQDALGSGRALETPLQQIPGGRPAPFGTGVPTFGSTQFYGTAGTPTYSIRNTFSDELRFREAVVFGSAPSGLSFRGDTLPGRFDFRGELGDDTLFAYRRDSMVSGFAGRGMRGTDALQYQMALSTGGQVPNSLAGSFSYARAGTAERSADPSQPGARDLSNPGQGLFVSSERDDSLMPAIEAGSSLIQPVRSLSSYTANRSFQPNLMGVMENRVTQQAAGQTASPLMGLQTVPIGELRNPVPTTVQVPQIPVPQVRGIQPPTGGDPNVLRPAPAPAAPATGPRPTAYDELLTRYKDLALPGGEFGDPAGGGSEIPAWARDIVALQATLRGMSPSEQAAMGLIPPRPEMTGPGAPPDISDDDDEATQAAFNQDVLRRIREAGGVTESLIAVDLPQIDRYGAYMQGAQDLLAKERYFDAEERFISAMTARPGDINAAVGRAHAQLGAGLFLSAGLNLRQLLVAHPEIAGMRYGKGLLPSPERIQSIRELLGESLDSPTAGTDSGLLLAYLGFQTENEDDIRAGLGAMERLGDDADVRLAVMLRGVWLEQAAAPQETAPDADGGEGG